MDAAKMKELRDLTGAGISDCKDALEKAGGEISKALGLLREKHLDRAGKLADKEAKTGRIEAYVHSTESQKGKSGVLLEMSCQTDFVAKSDEFAALLHDVALQISAMNPKYLSKETVPAAEIEAEKTRFASDLKDKPPQVQEKIVQGRLDKNFFARVCLLSMPFVNEAKFKGTVNELIQTKSAKFGEKIEVRRFARFEIGRETSFADRAR